MVLRTALLYFHQARATVAVCVASCFLVAIHGCSDFGATDSDSTRSGFDAAGNGADGPRPGDTDPAADASAADVIDDAVKAESAVSGPAGDRCGAQTGTCIIDCTKGDCLQGVQCPSGRDCLFRCAGGMCPVIRCAAYQRCIIDCPADAKESCRSSSYHETSARSVCIRCGTCAVVACSASSRRGCSDNTQGIMPNGCDTTWCTAPTAPECEP